jgi:hypothetical protein
MQEPLQQPRPSHDDIAALAYEIWERNGRPAGREVEFWLRAEQSLLSSSNPQPQGATPFARNVPPQDKPAAAKLPGPQSRKPAPRLPKGGPAPARQPSEFVGIAKRPIGGVAGPGF